MKKNRGFTLIEILVVMVVIGILAAIAIPSYQSQLRRGTRSAAQAVMMDLANKQQLYLQGNRAYSTGSGSVAELGISKLPDEVGSFYTFDVTADNTKAPPTFVITAKAISGTRQYADGDLTLDEKGTKGPAGKW